VKLMRPCVVSNQTADNSRLLATEAHPNPSIPELAAENFRGKKELFSKISLPSAFFNRNYCRSS
jgi:hypothetical protein